MEYLEILFIQWLHIISHLSMGRVSFSYKSMLTYNVYVKIIYIKGNRFKNDVKISSNIKHKGVSHLRRSSYLRGKYNL